MPRRKKAGFRRRESLIGKDFFQAIDAERGRLSKAESLLGCLAISMEHADDCPLGPHYPDVAEVACDLLRQSIDGLDSLRLERLLDRSRVKEGSELPMTALGWSPAPAVLHETPCDAHEPVM